MSASVRPKSHRTAGDLFEPGLIERLETQYGDVVDIRAQVSCAIDFCRRKAVSNPSGLLVTWVRDAAAKARGGTMSPAAQTEEMDRYAAFQAEVYRVVAEQQLGPAAIARVLDEARRSGLSKLSTRTIERLSALGERWPQG